MIYNKILIMLTFMMALAMLFLLHAGSASAVPIEEWNETTFGDANVYSIQQTSDGGFILAGYISTDYGLGWQAWLAKTDAKGIEQWNKTFGGKDSDVFYFVEQTSDGGFVITGYTSSYGNGYADGTGFEDVWLLKTDTNGNELWNKTFGDNEDDGGRIVRETLDGGYIILGDNNFNGWLIKTDSNGNQQWDKLFGRNIVISSVEITSDGGYILLADGIMKFDVIGNEQWSERMNEEEQSLSIYTSIKQTFDGDYIITGRTRINPHDKTDALILKVDKKGNELWKKSFGGYGDDISDYIQQTVDGGYIIAGSTSLYSTSSYEDIWLIKTDENLNELWNKTFSNKRKDYSYYFQKTSDSGYILITKEENGKIRFTKIRDIDEAKKQLSITDANKKKPKGNSSDIERFNEKSTPGFEVLAAVISFLILILLFSLKRERS